VVASSANEFSTPSLQNKLNPRIAWDALDNPLNPMSGWYLGGSFSYINALDLATRDFANFLKGEADVKFVFNIKKFLVFASYGRFGASATFGADNLPLTERYKLGGNKGVRGFGDGEIRQWNADGSLRETIIGGDFVVNGTGELRLPIVPDLGSFSLWTAGFFDWGGLADSISEFNAESIRMSAGVGLRLLLYGQVPLRLDYGIKLERRCLAFDSDTGACAERESLGELSFGVLYTF
jgi:outer membrane protein assembly factor BamA